MLRGAEMLAPEAEHLAHLLAWSSETGMTLDAMIGMPLYHPTFEEGGRGALEDACKRRG